MLLGSKSSSVSLTDMYESVYSYMQGEIFKLHKASPVIFVNISHNGAPYIKILINLTLNKRF